MTIGFSSVMRTVDMPGCAVSVIVQELPAYRAIRGSARRWWPLSNSLMLSTGSNMCRPSSETA